MGGQGPAGFGRPLVASAWPQGQGTVIGVTGRPPGAAASPSKDRCHRGHGAQSLGSPQGPPGPLVKRGWDCLCRGLVPSQSPSVPQDHARAGLGHSCHRQAEAVSKTSVPWSLQRGADLSFPPPPCAPRPTQRHRNVEGTGLEGGHAQALVADRQVGVIQEKTGGREQGVGVRVCMCVTACVCNCVCVRVCTHACRSTSLGRHDRQAWGEAL